MFSYLRSGLRPVGLVWQGASWLIALGADFSHWQDLLGPSVCGNTLVLRAGSIHLGARLLSGTKTHLPPEQRHVGLMFQEYGLFPHLTAAQSVGFGLCRSSKAERDQRMAELLAVVELADSASKFPHELSCGQQRIALARPLAPSLALWLLDEPFSNLDAATRERLTLEGRDILRAAGQTASWSRTTRSKPKPWPTRSAR